MTKDPTALNTAILIMPAVPTGRQPDRSGKP